MNRTPSHVTFSPLACTHFNVAHVAILAQGVLRTSSTCHLHVVVVLILFDPLLCAFHLLSHLPFHSFIFHIGKSPKRTSANEELGTMAENNPLTSYEPNFIDNYHISIKKGIRIQCKTENFVPIVVPGLSSSSSSSSHPSTSLTPSRQECDHPTSSSSSSTSPTMTSSTVSSDGGTREREDLSGSDSHPCLCQVC